MPTQPVHLLALQTRLDYEEFVTRQAFEKAVLERLERATQHLPRDEPRIAAFPELFALPLLFFLDTPTRVAQFKSSLGAALWLMTGRIRQVWSHGGISPLAFYRWRAASVWPVYQEVMQQAAQRHNCYLVAGSLFSPLVDWEPSRGWHAADHRVHNLGLVISPSGTPLARTGKLCLTQPERLAQIRAGDWGSQVVHTDLGTLANLICLDAFHDRWIERADAAGAWLVVQPSANAANWGRPWPPNHQLSEGEAWVKYGLASKLPGRENLRFGLNPMLNGQLFELCFEGQSAIYAATGLLAQAAQPVGEATVHARVAINLTIQK